LKRIPAMSLVTHPLVHHGNSRSKSFILALGTAITSSINFAVNIHQIDCNYNIYNSLAYLRLAACGKNTTMTGNWRRKEVSFLFS